MPGPGRHGGALAREFALHRGELATSSSCNPRAKWLRSFLRRHQVAGQLAQLVVLSATSTPDKSCVGSRS